MWHESVGVTVARPAYPRPSQRLPAGPGSGKRSVLSVDRGRMRGMTQVSVLDIAIFDAPDIEKAGRFYAEPTERDFEWYLRTV